MKRFPFLGIILFFLVSILVSLSTIAISEALSIGLFPGIKNYPYLTMLIICLITGVFIFFYDKYRTNFLTVRMLSQHPCEPHACLILLLSTPNIKPRLVNFPWDLTYEDKSLNTIKTVTIKGTSLEKDIEALNSIRWNWQQILRGLVPHKHENELKMVYLIGSKGNNGSFSSVKEAEKLIKQYFPDVTINKTEKEEDAVDFENFNSLVKCLKKTITIVKEAGYSENDIIIDITGGQKTASIAGASITFDNDEITFQYVQTTDPYNVLAYNVVVKTPVSI